MNDDVLFYATVSGLALIVLTIVVSTVFAHVIRFPPYSRPKAGQPLSKDAVAAAWGAHHTDPKHDFDLDFEDVEFSSLCGNTLRGWFIDRRSTNTGDSNAEWKKDFIVVFVHGGGRDRRAFLRHTPFVCTSGTDGKGGLSALLYDSRGHGASDLDHIGLSLGVREHKDVMAAIAYAQETLGFKKIILCGTSIGAYSSILATAKLPGDAAVCGIIAENPFTSIRDNVEGIVLNILFRRILCRCGERFVRLASPARSIIHRLVWWFVACGLGSDVHSPVNNALAVVHRVKAPILFMHGEGDRLIHFDHTLQLYQRAQEPKELWLAPGADHCALLNVHQDEYIRRMLGFLMARVEEYRKEKTS